MQDAPLTLNSGHLLDEDAWKIAHLSHEVITVAPHYYHSIDRDFFSITSYVYYFFTL